MDLRNIFGDVLFSAAVSTVKELVLEAIEAKINLQSANLRSADLRSADLRYANLRYADLRYADLRYADLRYANLQSADLRSADLQSADLRYANLRYADLRYANLRYANLRSADLQSADLRSADLQSADLQSADLQSADLRSADLQSADLRSAKNYEYAAAVTTLLPEGNLVGWKKCRDNIIVKVLIPQKARRSNSTGRKCRAEYVQVLQVFGGEVGVSQHDKVTEYRKGQIVKCAQWDENRWEECGGGIHFFITRLEAEKY